MNLKRTKILKTIVWIFASSFVFSIIKYTIRDGDGDSDSWWRLSAGKNSHSNLNKFKINPLYMKTILQSTCSCRSEIVQVEAKSRETYTVHVIKPSGNKSLTGRTYTIDEGSIMTCDSYVTLRRGTGQKIIAFSIYGENKFYYRYLKLIAQTAKRVYPDWVVRFYHNDQVLLNKTQLCELECLKDDRSGEYLDNVDFCNVARLPVSNLNVNFLIPTFWRWLPAGDYFVQTFLSRDSDFCLIERDRDAVYDWLNNTRTVFHLMRDHPLHDVFMLAGMWGLSNERDRHLAMRMFNTIVDGRLSDWHSANARNKHADQIFLQEHFKPIVEKNVTIHDSFHCARLGGRPFPTQRPEFYCHVGGYGCCGVQFMNSSFPHECPYECRPQNHKEWVFC